MIDSKVVVRVLGPIGVEGRHGAVPVGGTLPRGLLAVLALESPRPVSLDRLTSLLWGDFPPAGVKVAVQQLATRVRRSLAAAGFADSLRAVVPGYALELDPENIDVRVFRTAVRASTEAQRGGNHDAAARTLVPALDLWRGPALAEVVDLPLAMMMAPALDDERWRAVEMCAESLLASHRASECAELLAYATTQAPIRERLWVLSARALMAAGQPADAVRVARTGVAIVTAELGVPPSPELAAIEANLRLPLALVTSTRFDDSHRNPLLDPALRRAMDSAEQAAIAASKRLAHDEAVRQWQRALELWESIDDRDNSRHLQLLLGLGHSHNAASLDSDAQRVFRLAADVARRLRDDTGFATATLGYCSDRVALVPSIEDQQMLEDALEMVDPSDHHLRARLLARLALQHWITSIERTLELALEATSEADLADDDQSRLEAHYALGFAYWSPDTTERLVEVTEDYLADAVAAGDHRHQLFAHRFLVLAVTELGDVARGSSEARVSMEMADELGLSKQQWVSRVIAASHQLVVGDLDRAEQLATEGLALGSVSEPSVALDYVSLFMWTLRFLQGRLGEIASLVEEVTSNPGVNVTRRLGLAVTRASLGSVAEARTILDEITPAALDREQRNVSWLTSLAAMAEAAALTGHRGAAEIVVERLRPYADRIAITTVNSTGPVAHHVGIAAWAAGHHDLGLTMLAKSIEFSDRVSAKVFGARSRLAMAERLASIGEVSRVVPLAAAAHEVAIEQGLVGVARSAEELIDTGESRPA